MVTSKQRHKGRPTPTAFVSRARPLRRSDLVARRRGILLLDLVLGTVVTATIIAGTLVVLAGVQKQRQISRQYFLAEQILANVAEAIDAAATGQEESITLPPDAAKALLSPSLTIDLRPATTFQVDGDSVVGSARQIDCRIAWEAKTGVTRTASLTIWKHPREGVRLDGEDQDDDSNASTAVDPEALP